MKKIFTLSLAVATCISASAGELKILSCGQGIPGRDEPQLMGLGISPDGRYTCGPAENGTAIFVADNETGIVKWNLANSDQGGELRHIDNNGVAIGYSLGGITFSFATGQETPLSTPEGYRYVLGEAITGDGSMMVGSLIGETFATRAVYSRDGKEWHTLPLPSIEENGPLVPSNPASAAKFISNDGKVILGCLGSFTIPVAWVMNDAGEYEVDFFPARYVRENAGDIGSADKELNALSAMYMNLSCNGHYISLLGLYYDAEANTYRNIPVIYDAIEKKITLYKESQSIDEYGDGLYPSAICDDGTFIGTIGQPYFHSSGTFIMKTGQTQATLYTEAFPEYEAKLGEGDRLGFNMPTAMSADGRYLLGYTYYCEDYMNSDADDYYVTYIIDTQASGAAIDLITPDASAQSEPVEIYNIGGQRLNDLTPGINIVRMSDGTVRKMIKR